MDAETTRISLTEADINETWRKVLGVQKLAAGPLVLTTAELRQRLNVSERQIRRLLKVAIEKGAVRRVKTLRLNSLNVEVPVSAYDIVNWQELLNELG